MAEEWKPEIAVKNMTAIKLFTIHSPCIAYDWLNKV